jgi:ribosomal protein S18 acetylase RimI-like enzyme
MHIRAPHTPEEWEAYFRLRFTVLRQPWHQPEGSERLPDEAQATHAAAYAETGELLGVARLQKNSENTGQVRCVAVSPEAQGKGVGKALMAYLEAAARRQGLTEIVLEAREGAVPFYLALGYQITKESYLLFGEIQHYTMRRTVI